jgi:hypothetical protein
MGIIGSAMIGARAGRRQPGAAAIERRLELEVACDIAECRRKVAADRCHDANCGHRDQRGDEAVFYCRDPVSVPDKSTNDPLAAIFDFIEQKRAGTHPYSPFKKKDGVIIGIWC